MNAKNVEIIEITHEKDQLVTTNQPALVKLGITNLKDLLTEKRVNGLLQLFRATHAGRAFILDWEGGRVPCGVKILDVEIGMTQHGLVTNPDGDMIGTYDRLIDSRGTDKNKHRMLIYLDASAIHLIE